VNGTVLLAVLAALIVSARTGLNATVLGQPVSMPVLWLVFAAVVLLLAAAVLVLLRLLIRDGLRLRPRMVPT
jgi:hypothetical protein